MVQVGELFVELTALFCGGFIHLLQRKFLLIGAPVILCGHDAAGELLFKLIRFQKLSNMLHDQRELENLFDRWSFFAINDEHSCDQRFHFIGILL